VFRPERHTAKIFCHADFCHVAFSMCRDRANSSTCSERSSLCYLPTRQNRVSRSGTSSCGSGWAVLAAAPSSVSRTLRGHHHHRADASDSSSPSWSRSGCCRRAHRPLRSPSGERRPGGLPGANGWPYASFEEV
jgi:hypothetical protein